MKNINIDRVCNDSNTSTYNSIKFYFFDEKYHLEKTLERVTKLAQDTLCDMMTEVSNTESYCVNSSSSD